MAATEQPSSEDERTNSSYRGLTAFRRDMLWTIARLESEQADDVYGLGIKRELERYYGSEVNHGQLYPNLDALVEDGLVEKGEIDKRTNYYRLTNDGEEALQSRQSTVNAVRVD